MSVASLRGNHANSIVLSVTSLKGSRKSITSGKTELEHSTYHMKDEEGSIGVIDKRTMMVQHTFLCVLAYKVTLMIVYPDLSDKTLPGSL